MRAALIRRRIRGVCTLGATLQLCVHKVGRSLRSEWMRGAASFAETQAKNRGAAQ